MCRIALSCACVLAVSACQSEGTSAHQQSKKPNTICAFSIGHSLSSEIPDMVASLAKNTPGLSYSFQEQFRLGASLQMQWEETNKPANQWDDNRFRVKYGDALAKGGFNAVTLIDSVPRGGKDQEAQSIEYLTKFVEVIAKTNPTAEIYFAEAWHSTLSGTGKAQWDTISPTKNMDWRKRVEADAPMWERIRTAASKATGKKITIIPQARAMGKLVDAIQAGKVPGFKETRDVFGDDIHANPYGMYFVACVHYAYLFGRSPEGLTSDLRNRWNNEYWGKPFYGGKSYDRPNPEGIKAMQRIAWEVHNSH